VAFVLRSAAVKKTVPILSARVEKVFLCLAAILDLRNARVLFIMAKRHPVRNSQFMKAIRNVHSFFQEESYKIRNNEPVVRGSGHRFLCADSSYLPTQLPAIVCVC
jgi:hypothetical protein